MLLGWGGCTSTQCTWTGCTLHSALGLGGTLHTAHCKLHTAHCTMYTTHCTLHTAHCTVHNAYCTTQCMLINHQEMASNSTSSRQYPWHHFRVPPPLITSSARVSHGHCQCHLKTQPIQPVEELQWLVHWTVHRALVCFIQFSAQCECIGQIWSASVSTGQCTVHWLALVSAVHCVSALVSFGQREVVQ